MAIRSKYEFLSQALKDQVRERGSVLIEGTGNSMRPLIRSGQKVLVTRFDPDSLAVGDLVLFQLPEGLAVHRIVRVISQPERRFLCRGDRCLNYDPLVGPEDIIGKVRLIGKVVNFRNQFKRFRAKLRELFRARYRSIVPDNSPR